MGFIAIRPMAIIRTQMLGVSGGFVVLAWLKILDASSCLVSQNLALLAPHNMLVIYQKQPFSFMAFATGGFWLISLGEKRENL